MKRQPLVNEEIKPFFTFFQLTGLHYFSSNSRSSSKKVAPVFFLYFLVLAGLLIASLVAQRMVTPPVDHNDGKKIAVQKAIESGVLFGVFSASITILCEALLRISQHKNIFENFNKISALCWNRTYFKLDYKEFRRYFILKFYFLLFCIVIYHPKSLYY